MKNRLNPGTTILLLVFSSTMLLAALGCSKGGGGQPSNRETNCSKQYPDSPQMSDISFYPATEYAYGEGETVAFVFSNWCDIVPASDTLCRCRWYFDNLELVYQGTWQIPDPIMGTFRELHGPNGNEIEVELHVDAQGMLTGYDPNMGIIEGSSLALELPAIEIPQGLRLVAGGLCVVENIDGGDPGDL